MNCRGERAGPSARERGGVRADTFGGGGEAPGRCAVAHSVGGASGGPPRLPAPMRASILPWMGRPRLAAAGPGATAWLVAAMSASSSWSPPTAGGGERGSEFATRGKGGVDGPRYREWGGATCGVGRPALRPAMRALSGPRPVRVRRPPPLSARVYERVVRRCHNHHALSPSLSETSRRACFAAVGGRGGGGGGQAGGPYLGPAAGAGAGAGRGARMFVVALRWRQGLHPAARPTGVTGYATAEG